MQPRRSQSPFLRSPMRMSRRMGTATLRMRPVRDLDDSAPLPKAVYATPSTTGR